MVIIKDKYKNEGIQWVSQAVGHHVWLCGAVRLGLRRVSIAS